MLMLVLLAALSQFCSRFQQKKKKKGIAKIEIQQVLMKFDFDD